MAEGPLVHQYARQLSRILQGKAVDVEFGIKKLKESEPSLAGLHIDKVEAHGKQFRIHFSDQRVLLIHLMMWGAWRFYRRGQPWDKPRERARAILRTRTHEARDLLRSGRQAADAIRAAGEAELGKPRAGSPSL